MAATLAVYSRSWFFLRWYRLLYALPIYYFLIDVISYRLETFNSSLLNSIVSVLAFSLGIVLELFVIITVLKYIDMLDVNLSTWVLIRKYFWKTCAITFAGVFWTLLLISPFCFFVYLTILAEINNLFLLLLVIALLVYCVFYFGIYDLGLRILITTNKRIGESMWQGFRELSTHQNHYLPFVIVSVLFSVLPFVLAIFLSGTEIQFDDAITEILKSITLAERSRWRILGIINYIIIPLNTAATTFLYIDRNSGTDFYPPQIERLEPSG